MTQTFINLGHEIAYHNWRWAHYQNINEATECEYIRIGVEIIRELIGNVPLSWYIGRDSSNVWRLVIEHDGFAYGADYYDGNLLFWTEVETSPGEHKPHLVMPYTLGTDDTHFANPQDLNTADHLHQYLKDAFDVLYEEGDPNGPA